jgi:hypothetical protein
MIDSFESTHPSSSLFCETFFAAAAAAAAVTVLL